MFDSLRADRESELSATGRSQMGLPVRRRDQLPLEFKGLEKSWFLFAPTPHSIPKTRARTLFADGP